MSCYSISAKLGELKTFLKKSFLLKGNLCGKDAAGKLPAWGFWEGRHTDLWEGKLCQMLDEYSKQKAVILWISTSIIPVLLFGEMHKVTPIIR